MCPIISELNQIQKVNMSEEMEVNPDSLPAVTAAVSDMSLNQQTSTSKTGENKDKAKSKKGTKHVVCAREIVGIFSIFLLILFINSWHSAKSHRKCADSKNKEMGCWTW